MEKRLTLLHMAAAIQPCRVGLFNSADYAESIDREVNYPGQDSLIKTTHILRAKKNVRYGRDTKPQSGIVKATELAHPAPASTCLHGINRAVNVFRLRACRGKIN